MTSRSIPLLVRRAVTRCLVRTVPSAATTLSNGWTTCSRNASVRDDDPAAGEPPPHGTVGISQPARPQDSIGSDCMRVEAA